MLLTWPLLLKCDFHLFLILSIPTGFLKWFKPAFSQLKQFFLFCEFHQTMTSSKCLQSARSSFFWVPGGYQSHKSTYTYLGRPQARLGQLVCQGLEPATPSTEKQVDSFSHLQHSVLRLGSCQWNWVVAEMLPQPLGRSLMVPARPPTPCKSTKSRLPDTEITKGCRSLHRSHLKIYIYARQAMLSISCHFQSICFLFLPKKSSREMSSCFLSNKETTLERADFQAGW